MQKEKNPPVLVVEDDIFLRLVIADQFRDAGFAVIQAENADEALSVLRSGADVDVLVTDDVMPGSMDGLALAQLTHLERPATKVIVAFGNPPDLAAIGQDEFFSKPYDPRRIVERARNLLR
jgi:CheY-like chemotaxis protein